MRVFILVVCLLALLGAPVVFVFATLEPEASVTSGTAAGAVVGVADADGAMQVLSRFRKAYSDTSRSTRQLPFYEFADVDGMLLPDRCRLVGIELIDGAVELPTFKHPLRAAYVLGPERGSLTPEMLARCDHVIKIPTAFCINVATAGAIVMYDRIVSLGRFGQRATFSRNSGIPAEAHVRGEQKFRNKA